MVQTRAGAQNSEWLQFMRECAAEYRKRKEGAPKSGEPREEPPVTAPRKRKRDDKQPPSAHKSESQSS